MLVKKLTVTNFRNYRQEIVSFCPERNVIIGENAQGKTNLLEAIEFASVGKSYRTSTDSELINRGQDFAIVEVEFSAREYDHKISITVKRKNEASSASGAAPKSEKLIKVNGVAKGNTRGLKGHLVTVSFKSQDMSLIRGGPKDRRDWVDDLASILSTGFRTVLGRYEKAVTQRNRLLKNIFEKGKLTGSDIDELKVWDQQLATMGATIIKYRVKCLDQALPLATSYHERISGQRETLAATYYFHSTGSENQINDDELAEETGSPVPNTDLLNMDEREIAARLMQLYKSRRSDEITRRQTLSGPHRDDVRFTIDGNDATAFGSQGQQRSLVLALKLSELKLVSEHLGEPPILLLDDVMAELDLRRQGFLMESVHRGMQTLITTTHLDGFEKEWLSGATLISVVDGRVDKHESLMAATSTPSVETIARPELRS
jgi:DNA replication and repair protein RecF